MKPLGLALSISLLLFTTVHAANVHEPVAQTNMRVSTEATPMRLGSVKKISVAQLGTADGSELIRQKVIKPVSQKRHFVGSHKSRTR